MRKENQIEKKEGFLENGWQKKGGCRFVAFIRASPITLCRIPLITTPIYGIKLFNTSMMSAPNLTLGAGLLLAFVITQLWTQVMVPQCQ